MRRTPIGLTILSLSMLFPLMGEAKKPLPDPTRPPAGLSQSDKASAPDLTGKLNLRAIFFSDGRRLALINDRNLRETDQIGAARVVEILPDRVRMERDGSTFELSLVPLGIKTFSASDLNASHVAVSGTPDSLNHPGKFVEASPPTDSETARVENWGGPTMISTPSLTTHISPAAASIPASPAFPKADRPSSQSDGLSGQSSTQQTDTTPPSGSQTPNWLDALFGEGKEK